MRCVWGQGAGEEERETERERMGEEKGESPRQIKVKT
jgi:hypothetical protein